MKTGVLEVVMIRNRPTRTDEYGTITVGNLRLSSCCLTGNKIIAIRVNGFIINDIRQIMTRSHRDSWLLKIARKYVTIRTKSSGRGTKNKRKTILDGVKLNICLIYLNPILYYRVTLGKKITIITSYPCNADFIVNLNIKRHT